MELINLKFHTFETNIINLIVESDIPIYVCCSILKNILNNIEELCEEQIKNESLIKLKQEEPSDECTFDIPLNIINDDKEEESNE